MLIIIIIIIKRIKQIKQINKTLLNKMKLKDKHMFKVLLLEENKVLKQIKRINNNENYNLKNQWFLQNFYQMKV